jgi:hypothetical protein
MCSHDCSRGSERRGRRSAEIEVDRLRQVEGDGMKHKRRSKGPFVAVPKAIMATPAWRVMSPEGRLLWIDLRGWLRNDGLNNGKMHRSCRAAAEALGLHKDTIARRFAENEHYGFLRKTAEGFLGSDGRGIAAKYRFTDLAHGAHPPTRDFEKWTGELFVYIPRRGDRKKQNPVLQRRTRCPTASDIQTAPGEGSVCPVPWDIGNASTCPTGPDISRLPFPSAGDEGIQGSLTVRAPAQAGDAGSSPAPVAIRPYRHSREGLMAYVADVTETQLRNVDEAKEVRGANGIKGANRGDDDLDLPTDLQPTLAVFPTADTAEIAQTRSPEGISALADPNLEGETIEGATVQLPPWREWNAKMMKSRTVPADRRQRTKMSRAVSNHLGAGSAEADQGPRAAISAIRCDV